MKNFRKLALSAFLISLASLSFAEQTEDFVACLGRVVPEARIAKLSAASPSGQSVVAKLFIKRGSEVKEGQPIAELEGLARANAEVARAQAALSAVKAASEVKILQQKNLVADLEGTYEQNKKVLVEKDPPRREREQMEYEQDTLLRHISQAKAMLPLVEASQKSLIAESEAALEVSKSIAAEYIVRSPIAGLVVETNIRRGEAVGMDGICEIANTSNMFVDAEVYVSDIQKIKVGDTAEIFGDLLGDKKFAGKVVEISNYVKGNKIFSSDPTHYSNLRVVLVKIALENSAAFKKFIGSQVNVRISVK